MNQFIWTWEDQVNGVPLIMTKDAKYVLCCIVPTYIWLYRCFYMSFVYRIIVIIGYNICRKDNLHLYTTIILKRAYSRRNTAVVAGQNTYTLCNYGLNAAYKKGRLDI